MEVTLTRAKWYLNDEMAKKKSMVRLIKYYLSIVSNFFIFRAWPILLYPIFHETLKYRRNISIGVPLDLSTPTEMGYMSENSAKKGNTTCYYNLC